MTNVTLGFPIMLEEDNVIGNLLNLTGFRKHSHC